MERAIIHLNVADFAVAVERNLDPRLRQRPLIIAPEGAARATVYDMSEEAYQAGVRKGMPLRRARRRCPDARLVPPHPPLYGQVMRALTRQAKPYSPLIEPGEADDEGRLLLERRAVGVSRQGVLRPLAKAVDLRPPLEGAGHRPPGAPNETQKSLLRQMQQYVAACADDLGIAAETLASKRDLAAVIIGGERESRLLTGWRRELIGDQLLELL